MFKGVSLLRKAEEEKKGPSEKAKELQDYLKKYSGEESGKKKRKVKKKRRSSAHSNVNIIDEDVTGFAANKNERDLELEDKDEDAPAIANQEEVEVIKRQAQKAKEYYKSGGWAKVDDDDQRVSSRRHGSDSPDQSPPRRRVRHDSPDQSPPRRVRHDSPDQSPPRRRVRHDSPDQSPPRRRVRHDSPDQSPPRRRVRHDSPDQSPPRRVRHDSPDQSPPRRVSRKRDASVDAEQEVDAKKSRRMADGTKTGMVTGDELRAQLEEKRRREKERFHKLGRDMTGQGAETVYRDKKHGGRVSLEELKKAQEKKEVKWEKVEWSSGLTQQRAAERRRAEIEHEASKPFARTHDDEDLDNMLKERSRWGDPMAHLKKKKKGNNFDEPAPVINDSNREMFKKSGYIIPQDVPPHSWLKRGVPAALNRYGIRPGRHWDGVDRSNGFEKEMLKLRNEKAAQEKEAMLWSMEDM